jgi:hypothetical protein
MSNKIETPDSVEVIPQFPYFGDIADLDTDNFSIGGKAFMIKNENDAEVELEVMPARGDAFVSTKFYQGWNLELVKEVKKNTVLTTELDNLKWGH